MPKHKPSFFERLTGAIRIDDTEEDVYEHDLEQAQQEERHITPQHHGTPADEQYEDDTIEEEGQLTIDMYETDTHIVVKSIVAGIKPDDLDISIAADRITIRGKREGDRTVERDSYYHQELYWGAFSRTILLPSEIDVDAASAVEKHGLLMIKLPKVNKNRQAKIKVKSS